MAATEATRRNHILRTSRVTSRRGAHAPVPAKVTGAAAEDTRTTPAMHITPNVVIAARGVVRPAKGERRSTSLRSLRRFAA